MPTKQARAVGSVVLERTVLELQGEACLAFDDIEPQRKGMAVTRSAGEPMKDFDTVFQAVTAHATRAAEKLRQHGLVAGTLTVPGRTHCWFLKCRSYCNDFGHEWKFGLLRGRPVSSSFFDMMFANCFCL
jgi:hypothetical protein